MRRSRLSLWDAPSQSDRDLAAPIHDAAKKGDVAAITATLDAGADVNALTYGGKYRSTRTPVHLAIRFGYPEVADYLMAHGVIVPKPTPITAKLAAANPEKGRIFFSENCTSCHYGEPNQGRTNGPNLWGVVGREKASMTDAPTSKVLRDWGGVWTYEDLNTYLYGPSLTKPGGFMEVPSIPDDDTRADLIAYLRTLSEKPIPLP